MKFQTLNTVETEDTTTLFSFEDGIEEVRGDPSDEALNCCGYSYYPTVPTFVEYDIKE